MYLVPLRQMNMEVERGRYVLRWKSRGDVRNQDIFRILMSMLSFGPLYKAAQPAEDHKYLDYSAMGVLPFFCQHAF